MPNDLSVSRGNQPSAASQAEPKPAAPAISKSPASTNSTLTSQEFNATKAELNKTIAKILNLTQGQIGDQGHRIRDAAALLVNYLNNPELDTGLKQQAMDLGTQLFSLGNRLGWLNQKGFDEFLPRALAWANRSVGNTATQTPSSASQTEPTNSQQSATGDVQQTSTAAQSAAAQPEADSANPSDNSSQPATTSNNTANQTNEADQSATSQIALVKSMLETISSEMIGLNSQAMGFPIDQVIAAAKAKVAELSTSKDLSEVKKQEIKELEEQAVKLEKFIKDNPNIKTLGDLLKVMNDQLDSKGTDMDEANATAIGALINLYSVLNPGSSLNKISRQAQTDGKTR
ncbi:hypothetical protein SAMN06265795_103310 [Noviherbaspirillum humi]|uniref:Uncharacterized protein n=1 Tax=Noviherbaspirillum humi TaxID=1688639 RepID=A0A239FDZ5_9BURK|nr:hypothetical protein [Noviherbaspirillum humi]SNS54971.1 hypothetical protein SAMN06265795_103310 [Noviherbaspirillum humi]